MDYHKALEIGELCDDEIKYSQTYKVHRILAAEAKVKIDIILASKITALRAKKSNLGYEMAIIMLMENNEEIQDYYRLMVENTAKYKSLEKMIEAIKSKISYAQSVMKYQKEHGG